MQVKTYNLIDQQELVRSIMESNDTSFFILNNSDRPDANNKPTAEQGLVAFTVRKSNNESVAIRVPPSWVPIDASMQASKKEIVESAEFNRALSAKAIIVLGKAEGLAIITADADSEAEYGRVMGIAQGVNNTEDASSNGMPIKESEDPWAEVTAGIRVTVDEVVEGNAQPSKLKSLLRRMGRSVTAIDNKYVNEKLPGLSNMTDAISGATVKVED